MNPELPTTTPKRRQATKRASVLIAKPKSSKNGKGMNGRVELTLDRDERGYDDF